MQGRIKVLKDVDKSNVFPMTHAKAVYVDEENTLDEKLNNIESQIIQQRKTYAELKELIENNKLVPGVQYVLTDYRTKYQQPTTNVIKEMDVEELILTASSKNTFEPIVFSTKFPADTIWYDFDNNVCEDNSTQRSGFILRRYDPISGNDAPQDWRTMLWVRYKPHRNSYYHNSSQRDYVLQSSGKPAMMNYIYKADNKLWMAKNTNVPTSPTDPNVFYEVYPDLDAPLLYNEKTQITAGIELIRGDLVEVPTFSGDCKINVIKPRIGNLLHNNVFSSGCHNNVLESSCYYNTFGKNCFNNNFSNVCHSNTLLGGNTNNSLSNSNYSNFLGLDSSRNKFGALCYNNIFISSCSNNSFGNTCYYNRFSYDCHSNSFGNNCNGNTFGNYYYSNSFGNDCDGNKFGYDCHINSLGNSCGNNSFGNDCNINSFGENCDGNTLGNDCSNNSFSNNCYSNRLGDVCWNNTFGNTCSNNGFSSDLRSNFIKKLNNKTFSTLPGVLEDSGVTVMFEQNLSSNYIYWYLRDSGVMEIVKIP
ncbi:hypothetical protein [Clostridium sp. UBA6640]|uniref:hypothetical protein n=1 Tax=Clostridium sp. UBA6640 TaxID=1946370 RepID=UPI0025BF5E77|nr:hypothetical protein [Clostridium sp. UBA6640]